MASGIEDLSFTDGVKIMPSDVIGGDTFTRHKNAIESTISSSFSALDVSVVSGLHDLIVRPAAMMTASVIDYIDEYEKKRTLSSVRDGTLPRSISDAILSNFFIERGAGTKAVGYVRVNLEKDSSFTRVSETIPFYTADSKKLYPTSTFQVVSSVTGPDEIKSFDSPNGYKYFVVPVISEAVGSGYNIDKDTQLMYDGSASGIISIVVHDGLSGGSDDESDIYVYEKVKASLSARGMFNQAGISSFLRQNFSQISFVSSKGTASEYVTRNTNNLIGARSGCACDIYISNRMNPVVKNFSLVASKVDDTGKYSLLVDKSIFPGHYSVASVAPKATDPSVGSYIIVSKTRIINTSPIGQGGISHLFSSDSDGIYSPYMETLVEFMYGLPAGETAYPPEVLVNCSVFGQEGILDMQAAVDSESNGVAMVDYLVKSASPCYVSIDRLEIKKTAGNDLSADDVLSVIEGYISRCNESGEIDSGEIISALHNLRGVERVSLPLTVNIKIIAPTAEAEEIALSSMSRVIVPSIPNKKIGPGLVKFIVDRGAIGLTIS